MNRIREDDSRSREVARNELNNIRSIDVSSHVADRLLNNRLDEEIYEEFWGVIHKISQRTVVPNHMEDCSTFEQNTGKTNESLRILQKNFCAS